MKVKLDENQVISILRRLGKVYGGSLTLVQSELMEGVIDDISYALDTPYGDRTVICKDGAVRDGAFVAPEIIDRKATKELLRIKEDDDAGN